MLDKQALVNDLIEMIERRKKEGAHLEFYMNPQKIMINDIIDLIKSGKYDVKQEKRDDVDEVQDPGYPVKSLGC